MLNGAKHFHEAKDVSYLLGIATQLRALVCFNEKKPANSNPLLLTLADEAGISLKLYSYPPKESEPGMVGHVYGLQTWSSKPDPQFKEYDLRSWLLTPAYHSDHAGKFESRNEVAKQLGDKSAAHYDKVKGETVDTLDRTFASQLNGRQFFLLDTSKAIFYLGVRLIRLSRLRIEGVAAAETHEWVTSLDNEFASKSLKAT